MSRPLNGRTRETANRAAQSSRLLSIQVSVGDEGEDMPSAGAPAGRVAPAPVNAETRWTLWDPEESNGAAHADAPSPTSPTEEERPPAPGEPRGGALTVADTKPVTAGLQTRERRMQKRAAAQGHEHAALPREPPHPFRQVVHWQLQDYGMLLGTDQLVFSSAEYPAMSLQLCDMRRPIRPLSILEFWLDNVMAAIPALAVCGHIDGTVKGYQVLKTEDLPQWPGASM